MKYFSTQPSNRIDIHSSLKHSTSAGDPLNRVKSTQETLSYIGPISEKIGVTRVSEITFMDRLYIPNYSVVLPGTEDRIWVYNGKGTTRDDAKVSALMEAIERHSALPSIYNKRIVRGTYSELSNSYGRVLHPAEVVEPVCSQYDEKRTIMDFLPAFDLMNDEDVLVPAQLALYGYSPKYPSVSIFPYFHTNGLASGNILEEAICHALCELIERDAVSIADLCTSTIPFNILEKIRESLEETRMSDVVNIENKFVDDMSIYPDVDSLELVTQFKEMKRLIDRFTFCNIPLFLKDITQKDIGIPTFMASSVEWITPDYGYFAKGYGTHPDSRIASARAITELSQTRAANIHGARDDLKKIRYNLNDELYKRRWQFVLTKSAKNRKYSENKTVKMNEIKTFVNNDILEDINFILSRLKKAGLKRAIIVDLTNPIIGIPVVRAIIPGLETFEVTNSIIGERAVNAFRRIHRSY
ncbi:MAG TPA: YcaO-like family protein [Nitrososphaeraceae archaeon]